MPAVSPRPFAAHVCARGPTVSRRTASRRTASCRRWIAMQTQCALSALAGVARYRRTSRGASGYLASGSFGSARGA
eukprot:7781867-Lingulodinium_polyedra.AAC.1